MNIFPQRLRRVEGLGQRARPNTRNFPRVPCSVCQNPVSLVWATFVIALDRFYCPSCRAKVLDKSRLSKEEE